MISRRLFCVSTAALTGCDSFAEPQQAGIRPDLYNLEDAGHSLEWDERTIAWRTRIALPREPGEPFTLSGRTLSADTGAPVAGVVVMAYHTDASGVYPLSGPPRRIRLRAWTRTGADGRYAFDTIKPGVYPSREGPAHVHMTVIEPGRRPYYIDNAVLEGEYGVTSAYRAGQELRGGSGIIRLTRDASGTWLGARDIRLERHPA